MTPAERVPGKIFFSNGRSADWNWYGMVEKEGALCIKGDPLVLRKLIDDLFIPLERVPSKATFHPYAALLYSGFSYAEAEKGKCTPSDLHGFFFVMEEDDISALLVLPSILRDVLASNSEIDESELPPVRLSNTGPHTGRGSDEASFSTAACMFRKITGSNPFPDHPFSSPAERARLCGPLIPSGFGSVPCMSLLDRVLSLPAAFGKRGSYSISEVRGTLERFSDVLRGESEVLSSGDLAPAETNIPEELEKRRSAPLRRRIFYRQHRKKIFAVALSLAAVVLAVSFFFNLFFRSLPTDGLNAMEVAELFYESRNSLDHESLDAALRGSAGSAILNEITNLFVISRVRLGYEGSEAIISAREWLEAGAPPVPEGKMLYGLAGVNMRREKSGEENARFRSFYLRLVPLGPGDGGNTGESLQYEIALVEEVLNLEYDGKRWAITEIIPVGSTALETDAALDYVNRQKRP
jgi:hypothetical protein